VTVAVDDSFLGADLDLGLAADAEGRTPLGPRGRLDLVPRPRPGVAPRALDVGTVTGRANLVQSLLLRLTTERGELTALGFPDYGTRHLALVGEPNTQRSRDLLKLYVLEALRQEPRLERVLEVVVRPGEGRENRGRADLAVRAIARGLHDPLSFVVPFSFEGPVT
jgi:phage baseplate assembly protein W